MSISLPPKPSLTQLKRQVRYWWDCLEFLHPKNPQ